MGEHTGEPRIPLAGFVVESYASASQSGEYSTGWRVIHLLPYRFDRILKDFGLDRAGAKIYARMLTKKAGTK
jgi:hypothetical protein